MSADGQGGAGRREVAYRLFAAEYDDAELEHSESDEERAPNYVVTPTGARANRLFVVGVLTEVESVSEDVLRGRVVDPTGAFVLYAGQYQPDARAFLDRAEPPAFVAVTGKARAFRPDGSDRVLTSIRPESINEVDAGTRDRWTVGAAERTIDRVETFAAALDRPERGDDLREALLDAGVDAGLAAGTPLAIEGYGTTTGYLDAVRRLAIEAAEVVAGERDEVSPLDLAPDEGGEAAVPAADLGTTGEGAAPETATGGGTEEAAPEPSAEDEPAEGGTASEPEPGAGAEGEEAVEAGAGAGLDGSSESDASSPGDDADGGPGSGVEADEPGVTGTDEPAAGTGTEESAVETGAGSDGPGDFDEFGSGTTGGFDDGEFDEDESALEADDGGRPDPGADSDGDPAAEIGDDEGSGDEMYEFDEGEREAIEEEYGTEFNTGTEVEEPGEAGIETPEPEPPGAESGSGEPSESPGPAETETAPDEGAPGTEAEAGTAAADPDDSSSAGTEPADGPESGADSEPPAEDEPGEEAEAAGDVDLEEAVVDEMRDLDDGDGADRDAVIEAVASTHGVPEADVEDAIQDALMGGRCYEPDEGRLKPI